MRVPSMRMSFSVGRFRTQMESRSFPNWPAPTTSHCRRPLLPSKNPSATSNRSVPNRTEARESLIVELSPVAAPLNEHIAMAQADRQPAKDAPSLATALATDADLLVTGDRAHLGRLLEQCIGLASHKKPRAAFRPAVYPASWSRGHARPDRHRHRAGTATAAYSGPQHAERH